MRSTLLLCWGRERQGRGIDHIIARRMLDALTRQEVSNYCRIFRALKELRCRSVDLGQADLPPKHDQRCKRFGVSLECACKCRAYERFHSGHAPRTIPLADQYLLAGDLLYDRPQVLGSLCAAFRIAGLPWLEAAVQGWTTVTYRVRLPVAGLPVGRGSHCAWRDGLSGSTMMIGWLPRAADMLITRGVRRCFVRHGGYLLPP